MARFKLKRSSSRRPCLTLAQILHWADEWHSNTGTWPEVTSGWIPGTDEKWSNIDHSLVLGRRGLPGGTTLGKLLSEQRGIRRRGHLPALTESLILLWADAHYRHKGEWPKAQSGGIARTQDETWMAVDRALRHGLRGLPGGSSLLRLLAKHRGVRNPHALPTLTEEQILGWIDSHHERTGEWPTVRSGAVEESPSETWAKVDMALQAGVRGLPGRSSVVRLLVERRGVRNRLHLPDLTEEQILSWADDYREQHGEWPCLSSGNVEFEETNWKAVNQALRKGSRGLPGGSSLLRLLTEHRGVKHALTSPPLTEDQVLAWADAHHKRTGQWPRLASGIVSGSPDLTWERLNKYLAAGYRGLPGGSSLSLLLLTRRDVRNRMHMPRLTVKQILAWADAHHKRTGEWPNTNSGEIADTTWSAVDRALVKGNRGLLGGFSLAKLLSKRRGLRYSHGLPPLTKEQILKWADEHHARTGEWPNGKSGMIVGSGGETWQYVCVALRDGTRGLSGGTSLVEMLRERRGVMPHWTEEEILTWADAHHARTGAWPTKSSGEIPESPGTNWKNVTVVLIQGGRGLPGGSSLAKLLAARRGVRHPKDLPKLTEDQIVKWAKQYRARTGKWPTVLAGEIPESELKWSAVDLALRRGNRGLPGGSSVMKLLQSRGLIK